MSILQLYRLKVLPMLVNQSVTYVGVSSVTYVGGRTTLHKLDVPKMFVAIVFFN